MPSLRRLLVLGGTKSGKSTYAERRVEETGLRAVYFATGSANDGEMAARIAAHRARRGSDWTTIEEPLELPGRLAAEAGVGRAVLVDCLTLWLANLMAAERDIAVESGRLVAAIRNADGPVVLVSNEVGGGVVPDNALARRFADAQGVLNQQVAAAVEEVVLIAAGLPLVLKSPELEAVR